MTSLAPLLVLSDVRRAGTSGVAVRLPSAHGRERAGEQRHTLIRPSYNTPGLSNKKFLDKKLDSRQAQNQKYKQKHFQLLCFLKKMRVWRKLAFSY